MPFAIWATPAMTALGNIFAIDFHSLANIGALAFLTGIISLIKSFLTTAQGNFVGAVAIR